MKFQIVLLALATIGVSACASIPESANSNQSCSTDTAQKEALLCQIPQAGTQPDNWKRNREHSSAPRGRAEL